MTEKVEILVEKGGSVKVRFSGYQGEACFAQANKIAELLKKVGIQASGDIKVQRTGDGAEVTVNATVQH